MGISQQIGASSLSKPGVCTSSTRPATPYEGQMIYETDTDKVLVWNGTAWTMVGVTTGFDDTVYAIEIGPGDGYIYLGGAFLNGDGTACTKVARWTGTAIEALTALLRCLAQGNAGWYRCTSRHNGAAMGR